MPRVYTRTKNRGGKTPTYRCERCSDPITPGEQYHEWAFRYGGTHRQHAKHGYPRASQLTQSNLSSVYAARESIEDFQPSPRDSTQGDLDYFESVKADAISILDDAQSQAEDTRDEYQGVIDEYPFTEEQNQEKVDAIESWIDEIDSARSEIEGIDLDEDEDDALEQAISEITDHLSNAAGALEV